MIKNLRLRLKTKMGQRPLFMQILFVIIAFTLMVVTSYIFTSDIVRKGIISDAEEALNNTQQKIAADIQESVTTINIITQTIRDMIIHVNDFEMIKGYMGNLAIGIKNNNDMHLTGLTSIFGIFDIYGGTGFNSLGFEETAAYPHEDRPWYIAAASAGNNVVITKPYTDYMTNKTVITYVKNMFDNDNNRLGIICIDVSFERIMEYAINTNFKEKGYGLIVDSDIAVIAHPAREFIGTELNDPNGRFVKIGNELYTKKNITEYKFTNYSGNASIAFFRLIENDWFLGVITPINSYYRNVRIMGLFLTTLGLLMTLGISVILIKINNARKMSENRTKAMFNAMPMCANFWNRQYENIDTNQESVRLFELSSRKEYLQRFHELSPEYQPDGRLSSEKAIALVDKAFNEGYCRFEWMHQKLNGEEIPCEVTLVRIEYEGDYVVTGWTRDLREHLALLAEMQRAHIAEASNKAKTSFLAKVSHEVRTPLNAILGITEIQMQNQKLPDETQDALEKIYDSGYLLLNIINDILDLSKIEAGMLELNPIRYDVPSLINDTIHLNIVMYSSKPINFIIDVDENIPTMLFGDHLRIKQVLNNLLSNAFKYTHGGEVKLSVEVESMPPAHIAAHDEAAAQVILVFKVSDTGQGMNKDQLDVLFDEYTRFNFEANRATIGTGLGMNITKQLVDMMNGEIFVESEVDKGTVFTLRLPQEVAGEGVLGKELVENLKLLHFDKLPHIKKAPQIIRDYMPYGRVLVVDDVETNLYVARGLMAPYGLSVDSVTSGFEVIEIVKKGISYDIIFMDHFMPRMDGIEATKILRKMGYTNPIIALTADAIAGQAEMFMQNGFDGFISKPIDIRQLNAALNSLVRDKYPSDVVEAARRLRNDQMKFAKENTPQLFAHRQILELFVKDAEKAINSLEEIDNNKYRRSNDVKLYIITVHSLKSALLHIGEHDLSVEALKLEKAGREGNIELVAKESLAFLGKIKAVIKKIKKIIFDDSNEVKYSVKIKDSEMALLKEKLEIIIASCAEYDNKPAEDALAILLAETFPQETYDLLNKITGYLLHSDFDEAARIARELLDRNADS